MPAPVVRFNLVEPADHGSGNLRDRYRAAAEVAAYPGERGVTTVRTEERHGSPDGWPPSPLAFASARAAGGNGVRRRERTRTAPPPRTTGTEPAAAGREGGQPISSSVLPFVSGTNFRTNGMESTAKAV
jgi:hypothetical protein